MARSQDSRDARSIAQVVRDRIDRGGERLWRLEDFGDLPFTAVAKALSRLTRARRIERLSKGVYYRARTTALGASLPNPAAMRELAARRKSIFPAGVAAANLLGFTTQSAARNELATSASNLPRKLVGPDAVVHTRRPAAWADLSEEDAAMLDFLRQVGRTSELSPEETVQRTLELLGGSGRFARLLKVADTEPPRVRALLGALGEALGRKPKTLARLRESLNPLTRFDFGMFSGLPAARSWQAKE